MRLCTAWSLLLLVAGCGVPTYPVVSNAPAAKHGPSGRSVTVAAGDTLYRIAKANNVSLRALIEVNRVRPPYTIYPGQVIALPGAAREHVVKRGETLYAVSRDYGVDSTTLARQNRLSPPYGLTPGTRLALPDGGADAAAPAQPGAPAQQIVATIHAAPPGSGPPALKPPAVERLPSSPAAEPESASAPAPSTPPPLPEPLVPVSVPPPAPLEPLAALPPRAGKAFGWPLRGKLLARYGAQGKGLHNDGINIAARAGSRVHAAESGVVAYAGNELRGFGNLLLIKHADGWVTAYGHNDKLLVGRGDVVKRGQPIALVGMSGNVSEPQLHFEIRRGQRALDPLKYLAPVTASLDVEASGG